MSSDGKLGLWYKNACLTGRLIDTYRICDGRSSRREAHVRPLMDEVPVVRKMKGALREELANMSLGGTNMRASLRAIDCFALVAGAFLFDFGVGWSGDIWSRGMWVTSSYGVGLGGNVHRLFYSISHALNLNNPSLSHQRRGETLRNLTNA